MQKINQQNYDLVFKEAFSLFNNKSLNFLGVDLPSVSSFLDTEFPEVETTNEMMDMNFRLKDGSILHLEEETDLSRKDLIRFAHYDLRLYNKYNTTIHTVVLTPANGSPGTKILDTGNLQYNVLQIVLANRDADLLLARITTALEKGDPINELELIFMPLMKSRLNRTELLRKTIELEKKLPKSEFREKVRELTLILADKIVDREILDELWEELSMLKVIKYAEEKGMEKGREEEREEGRREIVKNLLSLGMDDDFIIKATGLDIPTLERIKKLLTL